MTKIVVGLLIFLLAGMTSLAGEQLSLKQAIQVALQQSPVITKIKADLRAAEGQAGQAVASFLPQISAQGSIGKYYAKPTTVQMTVAGSTSSFSYGTDEQAELVKYSATLSQPIFTGGKLVNSLGLAQKGLKAAEWELKMVAQDVTFNVTRAYYDVIKAKKGLVLAEQSVKMAQTHKSRLKTMLGLGMATKADVLRTEVQLAKAQTGNTKARQALEIAQNNLNNVMGQDLEASLDLDVLEFIEDQRADYAYKVLLHIAYNARPDWQQYQLACRGAENEVGLAYSGLWPNVSLVGNYEKGAMAYSTYNAETDNWTALVSGSWTLFDGTATFNKIKAAKAKVASNKAEELILKRAIALEVKNAHFILKSARESLVTAKKAMELASENIKIADLRYQSGVGTNLEVIDAQVALTQSSLESLQAQYDLKLAKVRINKAIGREVY